jgi:hypothetical protein
VRLSLADPVILRIGHDLAGRPGTLADPRAAAAAGAVIDAG